MRADKGTKESGSSGSFGKRSVSSLDTAQGCAAADEVAAPPLPFCVCQVKGIYIEVVKVGKEWAKYLKLLVKCISITFTHHSITIIFTNSQPQQNNNEFNWTERFTSRESDSTEMASTGEN